MQIRMHVGSAAEMANERWSLDSPDIPHAIAAEITLLIERKA
jgi:hypothetical protein